MTKKLPRRWAKQVLPGADGATPVAHDPQSALDTERGVVPSGAPTRDAAHDAVGRGGLSSGGLSSGGLSSGGLSSAGLSSGGLSSAGLSSGGLSSGALARAAVAVPATPTARALVVDDDPEIRRALARLLRPELDVHLAGSVAQAEAVLARLDRVDVAFIDWELPDGTGEEILERLAHWPDAIRVLISARVVSSENPLKNRALANLVLGKPLALSVIEALKRAALALPHG